MRPYGLGKITEKKKVGFFDADDGLKSIRVIL